MQNLEIRLKIKELRLYNYEVAKILGISEYTFCRMLRNELSSEKKAEIIKAIEEAVNK